MDTVSREARSHNMAQIKSRGTKPEITVRRLLHGMGYRFRLHRRDLPGCPDIAFISKQKAIFVNGCFWHQHPSCSKGRIPDSNREYWVTKLARNAARDAKNAALLAGMGWDVMTVWECQLKQLENVADELVAFMESPLSQTGTVKDALCQNSAENTEGDCVA